MSETIFKCCNCCDHSRLLEPIQIDQHKFPCPECTPKNDASWETFGDLDRSLILDSLEY